MPPCRLALLLAALAGCGAQIDSCLRRKSNGECRTSGPESSYRLFGSDFILLRPRFKFGLQHVAKKMCIHFLLKRRVPCAEHVHVSSLCSLCVCVCMFSGLRNLIHRFFAARAKDHFLDWV